MDKISAILIADDDADIVRAAKFALAPKCERIETAASLEALTAQLEELSFEAVLLDMNFALGDRSGRDGLDGLARILASDATLSVVLMTSYGAVSLAVEALKRGAADFILKPWRNENLVAAINQAAVRTRNLRAQEALGLDDVERVTIEKALARHDGNIAQAAIALGLSRQGLYRRMSKHGL
jgi:DNA-binding NtrC family response regulator